MLDVERPAAARRASAPPGPAARAADPRRALVWGVVAMAALVAGSALLRTTVLGMGFWIDEGLSVGIADRPLGDIPGVLRQDGSPPLYYVLLHLWMPLFGRSEEATHALSLAIATASVPLAWGLARALLGTRAGWIAALLAAVNPFLTQYGQETRMYTLVVALGLISTAAFLAAFALRRRTWLPVFSVALALQLYTHAWTLFFAGATGLAWLVLAWRETSAAERRALLRDGALAYGGVALLYLPWLPTLLYQLGHTGAPWAVVPGPDLILDAFGRLLGRQAQFVLLIAAGAGIVAALRRERRPEPLAHRGPSRRAGSVAEARMALALLVIALGTLVLAWTASQVSPAWTLRYLAVCVAPLLLLATLGLARAGWIGWAGLAVVLVMWALDGPPESKSNVRSVAGSIEASLRPGDLVLSTQPEQVPVLAYYLGSHLRYATLWGPVRDLGVTDWRDGVARLRATAAARDFAPLVARLRRGQRLVLVQPIIYDRDRWSAPWTRLVRYRSLEWERAADGDRRLRPIAERPVLFVPPAPNPLRAVVYERVGS